MYHSLFESLCMVPDPRIERKKIYPLDFLLLIVFLSTLSGNTSWYEIEDYAEEYEEELKSLYEEIEAYFCPLFQKHILLDEQTELSHGRIETRRYESILNPLEIEANEVLTRRKGLRSIHKVVRKRRDKKSDKTSEEVAYYISSLTDVSSLKQAIRGHWAIENKLHHCLDVYFGHDASHKRTRNVAQIMDIIQKINLTRWRN